MKTAISFTYRETLAIIITAFVGQEIRGDNNIGFSIYYA